MKSLLLVCLAGSLAYADDTPAAPEPPPGTPPPTAAPAAAGGDWAEINTRPLVLPTGKLDVHGNFSILSITVPDGTGGTSTDTAEALAVGFTYGAMDKLEVGVDYFGIQLNPNASAQGDFDLRAAYSVMHTDKLDVAVNGGLNINLNGGSQTDLALELGATARYHVTPKVSVFTGLPALPPISGLPGFYQMRIGLNNSGPITLDLPVGIGIQGTPQIYAYLATDIASFGLSNADNAFIFADAIPIGLGAMYSANDKLDVGLQFSDDLKNAGDFYVISLVGRYYVK